MNLEILFIQRLNVYKKIKLYKRVYNVRGRYRLTGTLQQNDIIFK